MVYAMVLRLSVCMSVCHNYMSEFYNKSSAVAEIGDRLAATDMGRKVGALLWPFPWGKEARSLSNTMSPGLRTTSTPSRPTILVHPTAWPQYANVKRQTNRQRSHSMRRTVLQTVAQKWSNMLSRKQRRMVARDSRFLTPNVSAIFQWDYGVILYNGGGTNTRGV